MAVNEKEFEEMKALVMNQGQQLNELIGWIKANKEQEPAPAAVTQETKEEKKDEMPEWFRVYMAQNPPAVVSPQKEEKKDDEKPKKSKKEIAKDILAGIGVGAGVWLLGSSVFRAGQTYADRQSNLNLLTTNDPYGGTIDATVQELDLTK